MSGRVASWERRKQGVDMVGFLDPLQAVDAANCMLGVCRVCVLLLAFCVKVQVTLSSIRKERK